MTRMLGQATAGALAPPRRWIRRVFGRGDIHERQKWSVVWPLLATLPSGPLRVLDAGCATGDWSLELATIRPEWTIVGVDVNPRAIATAQETCRRLGLERVSFREADFLSYEPAAPFDVVLSVASAHYLAETGRGPELFARFRRWLAPGGRLILLGPRASGEAGYGRWLPQGAPHPVFTRDGLAELCGGSGLSVEQLTPVIGRWGTLAKQVDWRLQRAAIASAAAYPLLLALSAVDARRLRGNADRSIMWLLEAHASG